jgi:hypothetical protein
MFEAPITLEVRTDPTRQHCASGRSSVLVTTSDCATICYENKSESLMVKNWRTALAVSA